MSASDRSGLGEERGSALVVAILVTVAILALGLSTLAFADQQSRQGGTERIQESTFNLTEAALRQQVFLVSTNGWPGSPASAYPTCTQDSAPSLTRCPDAAGLRSSYGAGDYSAGHAWETTVRDNGGQVADYYTTAGASSQPGWDENGDGKVWVRAGSTVHGRTRAVVTLVSARRVPVSFFPRQVVTAGRFLTGNKGSKVVVDTQGQTGQPSGVQVRCTPASSSSCVSYRSGQVSPGTVTAGYTGGDAVTEDELNGLRGIARQNGTYYASGCPSSLTGKLVFIESGNCSYGGNSVFNSAASPGTVVIATGTLTLAGTVDFYGLVYGANKQRSSGNVVTVAANAFIRGAVSVDGDGGVSIGQSGNNLIWDPTAIDQLETYGQAATVDGTWRELVPGS